jgi:cyclophilin family peptidyl-prolyl cis-trans isomerase
MFRRRDVFEAIAGWKASDVRGQRPTAPQTSTRQFAQVNFKPPDFRTVCILVALVCAHLQARAGTLAQFRTTFGDIEVELYDQDKPATVQNFIRYVQSGRYTNEFSHRLVPGFVLQGGGFAVTNRDTTNWASIAVATYPPVTNEFSAGKFYSNVFGTIAMAKTSDPNSATSQFFFNLADNSASLDNTNNSGGFTVFGHVISGTNVLGMFNTFQYWLPQFGIMPQPTNLVLEYYAAPFDTWPLLYPGVTDTNFIFMDITLLQIAIQPVAGGLEISWNSAAGMTNIVEFTTNLPPTWNTLASTNGTGSRMAVLDAVAAPRRFYRVRVAN